MHTKQLKMLVLSNFVGDIITHEHAIAAQLDPEKVFAAVGVAEALAEGCLVYEDLTSACGWVYPLPMFNTFKQLTTPTYDRYKKYRLEYEGFLGRWLNEQ